MFIDTSVIVALLAAEPDAYDLAAQIADAPVRMTSPLVVLEAAMRLSTLMDLEPTLIEKKIRAVLDDAQIRVVSIDDAIGRKAIEAFSKYGKGRGHPAP